MSQELHAVTEALLQLHLQRVIAARRFVRVVTEALRPVEWMSEPNPQQLRVAIEVRLAIVVCETAVKSGQGGLVGIELVRRIEHIVDAVATHISDLESRRVVELLLDGQVPCIQGRQSNRQRPCGNANAGGERKIAVRWDCSERIGRRTLRQIEQRSKTSCRIQVLRHLYRISESQHFAEEVA